MAGAKFVSLLKVGGKVCQIKKLRVKIANKPFKSSYINILVFEKKLK